MCLRAYFLLSLICLHIASAVDIAEKQVKLFYGLAQGNYLIGDHNRAVRDLDEILRINPNYCRAYLLKARIDLDGQELTEALAEANSRESDSASELLSLLLLEDDSENLEENSEENTSRKRARIHNNIQKIDLQAVEKVLASMDAILAEHPVPLKTRDLSGLGNIYVNEILFLAGVHPLSKTFKLKEKK